MTAAPSAPRSENPPALPPTFRPFPAFAALNIAAVGLSLGAIVSLPAALADSAAPLGIVVGLGLPTAFVGARWVRGLRSRPAGGWLGSIGYAWLNSTLIGTVAPALSPPRDFAHWLEGTLMGGFVGATIGALVWIPALLATLLVFGLPIAGARKLSRRGFSGTDLGEALVGGVSAVIGSLALVGLASGRPDLGSGIVTGALGLVGAAAGGLACVLAFGRELARRQFVQRVEAGAIRGYRVADTPEGRRLMQMPTGGNAYREGDFLVAVLTEEGAVTRVT
jgi:hypothetical protein